MYQTQRTEEDVPACRTRLSLARGVFTVWEQGELADDEALREMLRILQGAFITPSGTRHREAHNRYNEELQPYVPMPNYRPFPSGLAEGGTTAVGGQNI